MNPNFMNNISPEQMQNNLNMMNPEMLKNASNMISGMSDAQLQMHLAQMGMTGMNPAMFRNMCKNMSNMDESQINLMKNMAQNNYNNMVNNNKSNNSSNNTKNLKGTIVEIVTKMKEDGNILFKKEKFEEAIKKYYETIEEIKTSIDKDKYKNELDEVEKSCRLNIANCKLKTKDYDGVINECSIVLEKVKCFKAYYRMGIALMNKNKYDKAYRFLDNANSIGNASEKSSVEKYLIECKQKLDEIRKKEREERLKKEKESNQKEIKEEEIMEDKKEDKKKEDKNEEKKEEKKDTQKNEIEKNVSEEKEKKDNNNDIEDDIKVEDSKDYNKPNIIHNNNNNNNNINNNFNTNNNYFNNIPPNINQDYINQARNQMNNMSDEQMNFMVNQMKSMDNQTLKNLMASQGMNITDQQIEMMKTAITPETLKMLKNNNFQPPNINNPNIQNNQNNQNISNNNINNNAMPQMPNLNNMDFSQMMNFVKSNPELLKSLSPQLSQMLGGKNIDPQIMMKAMDNIMYLVSIPGRIKRFFLSWRGICFIIFIIAIYYGLFKKK